MCDAATAFTLLTSYAVNRQNARRQDNAAKRANKPPPTLPTQADAAVRNATQRARLSSKSGSQSSTRITNPLGIVGGAGQGKTLLGE